MQAFPPLFPLESVVYIVVSGTYSTKLVRALLCLTPFCDFSSSILKKQVLSLMNIEGFHDLSPSSLVHFVSLLSLTHHSQWSGLTVSSQFPEDANLFHIFKFSDRLMHFPGMCTQHISSLLVHLTHSCSVF